MILLDTHIWMWWVHDDPMPWELKDALDDRAESEGLGVSVISCWEVAKLVEYGRVELKRGLEGWLSNALAPSGVSLVSLTPRIAAEACSLPGEFHRDPADQIIVATSRVFDMPLATADQKIRRYPYVTLLEGMTIHDG